MNAFNGSNNDFTAPFAGKYVVGFLRFKANGAIPTKVIATFYKNGAKLGRGYAVSGATIDDVTTYDLTILTPFAANDVIAVRANFATNDGHNESDQSRFWGAIRALNSKPSPTAPTAASGWIFMQTTNGATTSRCGA